MQHLFKETYQTLHPIFSLKKENLNKKFMGVENLSSGAAEITTNTMNMFGKGLGFASEDDNMSPSPLRDASNILQAIFKRHDFVF